jgi:mono/diheme cytochrome c family protein
MLKASLVVACLSALSLIGCKGENKSAPQTSTPATQPAANPATGTEGPTQPAAAVDPSSQARKVFKSKCVVCHGDHGAGDGPGAAALNPKPRAFGNADWQSTATDDQIKKAIVQGGAAVGKSPAMPANPDLRSKPEVVNELVKIIRGFKS